MTAIWWVRRDLRLADNLALAAAVAHGPAVPVFILDPALLASPYGSQKRLAFLLDGLRRLDADLRLRGSRLIVRQGDPVEQLAALVAETGARAVFAEADVSPYAVRRDARAAERLPLKWVGSPAVYAPGTVIKADGSPYTVFTPFSRAWKTQPPPDRADLLPPPGDLGSPGDLESLPIPRDPTLPPEMPFLPGEVEASRRLEVFVSSGGVFRYTEDRSRLDLEGTSGLSPYLRFGMISAYRAAAAALEAVAAAPDAESRRGAETWLNELIWREFYISILAHFSSVRRESFRADLRGVRWRSDEAEFAAWCEGRTGYPVVDAAMRQLVQTGWMHNRARMIAASFLTKDLLIDWRRGEQVFMSHLVDGDPAANNGGWQWTAGTGTDAAPYFRVFNPVVQGERLDPQGAYVRRWLPELARIPGAYVHRPWTMPPDVQQAAGCIIGKDYPRPMVDHAWARERALAAYTAARSEANHPGARRSGQA